MYFQGKVSVQMDSLNTYGSLPGVSLRPDVGLSSNPDHHDALV